MQAIITGCPHFNGEYRKYKNSDYNVTKALCDFIDNVITKCKNIDMKINKDSEDKIHDIIISDNYHNGFESIFEKGTHNPFNMAHMREGQYNDSETSQFGIGMKAGAISLCKIMTIYTKVKGKYYKILLDFEEMCKVENPYDSFNPKMFNIAEAEYNNYHIFEYGSTIKLTNIRNNMFSLNIDEDIKNIHANICNIYSNMIPIYNTTILLNDTELTQTPSYFDHANCKLFNRKILIYELQHNTANTIDYYIEENNEFKKFIHTKYCFRKCKYEDMRKKIESNQYKFTNMFSDQETHCAIMESTFTKFHPLFNTDNKLSKEEKTESLPRNDLVIYRDGRSYGNWELKRNGDGNNNYTTTKVELKSKKILTDLGLTFSKNIANIHDNLISHILRKVKKEICNKFNANISNATYVKLYEKAKENHIDIIKSFIPSQEKKRLAALEELVALEEEKKRLEELKLEEKKKQDTALEAEKKREIALKEEKKREIALKALEVETKLELEEKSLEPHKKDPYTENKSIKKLETIEDKPYEKNNQEASLETLAEVEKKKLELENEKKRVEAVEEKRKQHELEEKKKREVELVVVEKKKQEAAERKKQEAALAEEERLMNYQPWKKSFYFGIFDCHTDKGISAKEGYYKCKFGITEGDPNKRIPDGGGWRRLISMNINENGSKIIKNKYMIEWKINESITKSFNINWKSNSNEYFTCNIEDFKQIICKVMETLIPYSD